MLHADERIAMRTEVARATHFLLSKLDLFFIRLPLKRRLLVKQMITGRGLRGFLPCSNLAVRAASTEAMVDALLAYFDTNRVDPAFRFYLGTFVFDDGVTSLQAPRVDLRRIRRKVYKIMREHDLHGICTIEVEILLRLPGEAHPRVNFHVHTACWARDRVFHPVLTAETMMATDRFPNDLGAPAVDFRSVLHQTPATVAGLAHYITKVPACVKQRHPNGRGSFCLKHEQAKYSTRLVVRMFEILSDIDIYSTMFGVGEGKAVRLAWKRGFSAWVRQRRGPAPYELTRGRNARGWRKTRKHVPLPGLPCRITL